MYQGFKVISYLLRGTSIHCVPQQTLHSIFSFPGPRLQSLPSYSPTNSRRRTAEPAALSAAYRFFFRAPPLSNCSTSRCSGNLRFRREPSSHGELHRIFVVPLSSKNNQLAVVWAHLDISRRVLSQSVATWHRRFLFSPPAVQ